MKNDVDRPDGHEAEQLLRAWLKHVETYGKRASGKGEKAVIVLPDAEVADRKRKAPPPPTRARKRAKSHR